MGDSYMSIRNKKPVYGLKFEQCIARKVYIWFRTYCLDSLKYYFDLFYTIKRRTK